MRNQPHFSRILITDDDRSVRTYLATVLREDGLTPLEAADGDETLRLLDRTVVDLVLLDVRMPGQDGFSVLRQLKRRHRKLPVILMSGDGSIPAAVEAMKQGAADYLTKPLAPRELRRRLQDVLCTQDRAEVAGNTSSAQKQHPLACTHCNSRLLRPSSLRGIEPLFFLLLMRPYRCGTCLRRTWLPWTGRWLFALPKLLTYLLLEHPWAQRRRS